MESNGPVVNLELGDTPTNIRFGQLPSTGTALSQTPSSESAQAAETYGNGITNHN